jgi:hypothetical protein
MLVPVGLSPAGTLTLSSTKDKFVVDDKFVLRPFFSNNSTKQDDV